MLKKIKVSEFFTYDFVVVDESLKFFQKISDNLQVFLSNYIGLSESDYNASALGKLLTENWKELDEDYFIENSSEKYLSRYAQLLINKFGNHSLDLSIQIAKHVVTKFGLKWWKISENIVINYLSRLK